MSEYIYGTDEHDGHWLTGEEIVRCRDCKYSIAHGNGCTRNQDIYDAEPDGFCAWGERMMAGDAEKLLRCPFCGGIPEIEMETDSVACTKCGCMMFGKDVDSAIAAWNERALNA